jgi:hypothetical protein
MTVLFLPEVEDYLYELIEILYRKEYFGYKENAINYVTDLKNDIKTNLSNKVKRPALRYFLTNMERKCCIRHLGKARRHNGMCFSISTNTTES